MTVAIDKATGQVIGQVLDNPRYQYPGYVRIYSARNGYEDRPADSVRLEKVA